MKQTILLTLLSALALTSCQQTPSGSDAEDERNPFFRQASKDVADLNYPAAIKQFEKAVSVNPTVVKAYLQIGLLYGDKLGDPISAIYFYQKYLEARPNASDREEVVAAMEKAKIDFALTLTNSGIQNAAEIARMSKENIDLKQQITELQGTLRSQASSSLASCRSRCSSKSHGSCPCIPLPNQSPLKPQHQNLRSRQAPFLQCQRPRHPPRLQRPPRPQQMQNSTPSVAETHCGN